MNYGSLQLIQSFPSALVPARPVAIWAPEEYTRDDTTRFPVLYMQDGNMVFQPAAEGSNNWAVPETVTRLTEDGSIRPPIVVAVWANENRAGEYMPEKPLALPKADLFYAAHRNRHYIPRSESYLRFLATELKSYVDSSFRTLAGSGDTFILGCSRGALLSIYAVCEYPDVYSGAGCMSPHWPHGDGIVIDWLTDHLPEAGRHRFYFDHGDRGLDQAYAPYQRRMDDLMRGHGYRSDSDWSTRFFPGHDHSAGSWRSRLDVPLTFLFGR